MAKVPKITSLKFFWNNLRKKWKTVVFCLKIIAYKLILSSLLVVARHAYGTQKNNFLVSSISQERSERWNSWFACRKTTKFFKTSCFHFWWALHCWKQNWGLSNNVVLLLLDVLIFPWYLSLCLYPDFSNESWYGVTDISLLMKL